MTGVTGVIETVRPTFRDSREDEVEKFYICKGHDGMFVATTTHGYIGEITNNISLCNAPDFSVEFLKYYAEQEEENGDMELAHKLMRLSDTVAGYDAFEMAQLFYDLMFIQRIKDLTYDSKAIVPVISISSARENSRTRRKKRRQAEREKARRG